MRNMAGWCFVPLSAMSLLLISGRGTVPPYQEWRAAQSEFSGSGSVWSIDSADRRPVAVAPAQRARLLLRAFFSRIRYHFAAVHDSSASRYLRTQMPSVTG